MVNTQVRLRSRPQGWPTAENFEIVDVELPEVGEGEVLVRNRWLSLDPYMRGRIGEGKSYARKVELGEVMVGGTIGEVLESRHPDFSAGDLVVGFLGWQTHAVAKGGLQKLPRAPRIPVQAYLGAAGMPGVTAHYGLFEIGAPKPNETVVVSAASGAVGAVVGQLAKHHGCRAVGIAGGRDKCDYVVNELGFDACIDYKAGPIDEALKAAAPAGIDVYFENVGGRILDAALRRLNPFARIPLCGLVSQYNETEPYGVKHFQSLLTNRVKLQGFIISEHLDRWPAAISALERLIVDGKLRYRETIAEGLAAAPGAFIGMLRGENFGKQLVRV